MTHVHFTFSIFNSYKIREEGGGGGIEAGKGGLRLGCVRPDRHSPNRLEGMKIEEMG